MDISALWQAANCYRSLNSRNAAGVREKNCRDDQRRRPVDFERPFTGLSSLPAKDLLVSYADFDFPPVILFKPGWIKIFIPVVAIESAGSMAMEMQGIAGVNGTVDGAVQPPCQSWKPGRNRERAFGIALFLKASVNPAV